MSNEFSHIEITGGIIQSATITDANGTRDEPSLVGQYRFYVAVVNKDGGRIGMWDGESHKTAREEADFLRHDFKVVQILDLTGGAA